MTAIRAARSRWSGSHVRRNSSAASLALALALNIVMRVYLQRDLWMKVLETVEVHDMAAAANVRATGELASALGEGFADGLDVAGF